MTNRFFCDFSGNGDFYQNVWNLNEPFLGRGSVEVHGYYFFYCAQPNATSASIQNVKTNFREYYVKRLKINCCFSGVDNNAVNDYMMVFVLNVPQDYAPSKSDTRFRLSDLPSHTIPENVLYYDLVTFSYAKPLYPGQADDRYYSKDIRIDIKKTFKVSPSYKLAFVCYIFGGSGYIGERVKEGTVEVFFDVN